MDRESTTVRVYIYTDLIIDVDIHNMLEYLTELSKVSLAFTRKLEKSSLIVSLKGNKISSHMMIQQLINHRIVHKCIIGQFFFFNFKARTH